MTGYASVTMEAWIYKKANADWMRLFCWNDGTNIHQMGFPSSSNKLAVWRKIGAGDITTVSDTDVFPLNVWKHVVFVDDAGTLSIYIDGVKQTTETPTEFAVPTTQKLFIGTWLDGGTTEWFNGTIDEARIYNTAISEDRIRGRYLGAISAHKNAGNNLVMHLGPATMTTSVSGLSGWHHVAGTWDNTAPGKAYIFLDGEQKAEASFWGGTRRIFGDYSYFGNDEYNQMQLAGKMDEARISASARSGDWINTSHNNQVDATPGDGKFIKMLGDETGVPEGEDPVPELPTAILLGIGLVVLAGYVYVGGRRRRRGGR